MKNLFLVLALIFTTAVNAVSFHVTDDGDVNGYFVSSTAGYENLMTLSFAGSPLTIQPTINNHTSIFGQSTSFGFHQAGEAVTINDFVSDTMNLWSSNSSFNFDNFDHLFYSAFMLPNGTSALLVGFEDLSFGGDKDFDDNVVVFTNLSPVPEPMSYGMMLVGLIIVSSIMRSRQNV